MFVPYVLSIVLGQEKESFLILSDTDNMIRFFEKLDIPNVRVIRFLQARKGTIIRSRLSLMARTRGFDIRKVYFFHAEFGGVINWFILKKSRKAEVFYCKVFNGLPFPRATGWEARKYGLVQLACSGVRMTVLDDGKRFIPSLPSHYFERVRAVPCSVAIDQAKIKQVLSRCMDGVCSDAQVVLLTGSTVAMGFVEEKEYVEKTDALIEAIGPEKCVTKCHPRYDDVFSKELELPSIPSYIPGNLIIGNYDVFIGNQSTLLVEAAFAGKLAISLLEYYRQINESQVDRTKAFYQDRLAGRGEIHYPRSIGEILSLIRNR